VWCFLEPDFQGPVGRDCFVRVSVSAPFLNSKVRRTHLCTVFKFPRYPTLRGVNSLSHHLGPGRLPFGNPAIGLEYRESYQSPPVRNFLAGYNGFAIPLIGGMIPT
jgi:hypothetical protein